MPADRPRVLRIITRLNIGGPSLQAARLTTDLRRRGYDTWLVHGSVAAAEGDMRDLLARDDPQVIHVTSLQRPIAPAADLRAFSAISSILRTVQPDIVHTHMAKAGLIGRAATLLYNRTAGRRRPARIVHTYHGHVLDGYFSRAATAAIIQAERGLGRGTDRLIAISPRIERELVQRYRIAPASAFEVIPLGFDLAPLGAIDDQARAAARQALQVPDGDLVVSTVGRLTAIKNHELYLDAAEAVLKSVPRALFLIVGDGELRASLEASAATRGIAGRVRFLGWRRDLATVYGATDVFALTSRNEGTPVALIEAMAAGVPGVATDVGGVPDVICSPEIGVIAGNDGGAVAAALERLLASAAERRSIGDRARASVLSRYALPRLVDDIARLYAQLQAAGVTPRRQS